MKIKLKNADRLCTTLENEVSRLMGKINNLKMYSVFPDSETSEQTTLTVISDLLEKIEKMEAIRFHLRSEKGIFNEANGINKLTLAIAVQKAKIDRFTILSIFQRPVANYRQSTETSFTGGISESARESFHSKVLELDRGLQRLRDECQGKNSTGNLLLEESMVNDLKEFGLLD